MSDSVPSLKSVGRAIDRWLDCVDADRNEALKQAAIADLLTYSRHHDPAVKAAREAMEEAAGALACMEPSACGREWVDRLGYAPKCENCEAKDNLRTALAALREVGK